jgi:hypothetical protein
MRCKFCGNTSRSPPKEMREDLMCSNCRKNNKKNSAYSKKKLKEQMERSEKIIKKAKEKNSQISNNENNGFYKEAENLTKQYMSRKRKKMVDHNVELLDSLIDAYREIKNMQKLSEITQISIEQIKFYLHNLVRVPSEIREMVNNQEINNDDILSVEIALYVTDFFNWDGQQDKKEIEKIKNMTLQISKCFDDDINLKREFFGNNEKPKIKTKKSLITEEIASILEDYPIPKNSGDWRRGDRTGNQYNFLTKYCKVPDATRFVRRYEYEKGKRVPIGWASEMISEIKATGKMDKFLAKHEDEFLN